MGVHILKSKRCYNVIPLAHYFYIKTSMLADFQICISVPLTQKVGMGLMIKLQIMQQLTTLGTTLGTLGTFFQIRKS